MMQLSLLTMYLIMVVTILISIGIGFSFGNHTRKKRTKKNTLSLGSIIGAMLSLLAFMLAFTFSIVSSRYANRKQLVLYEANAIGTAFLRADFLEEPSRTESKKLFKDYVNMRVELINDHTKLNQILADSELLHDQLWSHLTQESNQNKDSELLGLYAESLNEVFDIHTMRYTTSIIYRTHLRFN